MLCLLSHPALASFVTVVSKSSGLASRPACSAAALLGLCALPAAVLPACSDNNLVAFNRKLQGYNYDLTSWRRAQQRRGGKDLQEGFQASCVVLNSRLTFMPLGDCRTGTPLKLCLLHPVSPDSLLVLQAGCGMLQRGGTTGG